MEAAVKRRETILNAGIGEWAFEEHARRLSRVMALPVSSTPAEFNYLLGWDAPEPPDGATFVPLDALLVASDKRRMAEVFQQGKVAVPRTYVLETPDEVRRLVSLESGTDWVLKWPVGCGAAGHRLIEPDAASPEGWPRPYLVQEFIRLPRPEVYRLYGVRGELFGWNVRRFPPGTPPSPWVAHARGARYEAAGPVPAKAEEQAGRALVAAGLAGSFGCVDLLPSPDGRWLVLEVGTDGLYSYVDREIGLPGAAEELDRRIAEGFREWAAVIRHPAEDPDE
jgi:hypothetical protein